MVGPLVAGRCEPVPSRRISINPQEPFSTLVSKCFLGTDAFPSAAILFSPGLCSDEKFRQRVIHLLNLLGSDFHRPH